MEMKPSFCEPSFFHLNFPYLQVIYLIFSTKVLFNEYAFILAIVITISSNIYIYFIVHFICFPGG